MTTYTSSENLRSYHHLKGEARKKAFKNMKGMYLENQFPDFIQEMKATLDTMGISIKEYEFGWDCARLWLEYRDPKRDLSYIKGVRAYSFIENNMLNCCQKREYRMKVYDRWNQPWSVYHGMNMIVRLSDKKWMEAYEYRTVKKAWEKFRFELRSGKEPTVQDFINYLSAEYIAAWVERSKSYTDDIAGLDAMKYMFDDNGDIYVYDKYADIRVDY